MRRATTGGSVAASLGPVDVLERMKGALRLPLNFHFKGGWHLLLGEWADMTEGLVPLDVFRCSQCKRVEFFDLDLTLPGR